MKDGIMEEYRLIVSHEIIDDSGEERKRMQIDEPLVFRFCNVRINSDAFSSPPVAVCINEIFERAKREALQRFGGVQE